MSRTYFFTSQRLGFRAWTEDDFPLAQRLWGNAEVTRLIGGPWSDEQVRAMFDEHVGYQRAHGYQYWPMFLRESGAFVGCGGVRPHHPDRGIAQIGFHLLPGYWRAGFTKEGARAVIDFAFTALHLEGLFAGHHPENDASRVLMRTLGFTQTGESFYEPTGRVHPIYMLWRGERTAEERR